MDSSGTLARLIARRARLLEKFDGERAQVDHLLQRMDAEPAMNDIALLEGLLTARRELLGQLAELDDELISYLLELREKDGGKGD